VDRGGRGMFKIPQHFEILRKTTKSIDQDGEPQGLQSNVGPPKYKAQVATAHPLRTSIEQWRLVFLPWCHWN
jgi:hypothetical protein